MLQNIAFLNEKFNSNSVKHQLQSNESSLLPSSHLGKSSSISTKCSKILSELVLFQIIVRAASILIYSTVFIVTIFFLKVQKLKNMIMIQKKEVKNIFNTRRNAQKNWKNMKNNNPKKECQNFDYICQKNLKGMQEIKTCMK